MWKRNVICCICYRSIVYLFCLWHFDILIICSCFKGRLHRRNNNKTVAPPLFWLKAEGWAWRNVTTLRLIDRAMNARTDPPLYKTYCFNHVMRLYSVWLHLQWRKTSLSFGLSVTFELSSWGIYKLYSSRINGYIYIYLSFINPKMDVATTDCPFRSIQKCVSLSMCPLGLWIFSFFISVN